MVLFDWECTSCGAVQEATADRSLPATQMKCKGCGKETTHIKQVGGRPKRTLKVKRHYLHNSVVRQGN